MDFKELNLQPFLLDAIDELEFSQLTPVQEAVIPEALAGKNLVVQSQTGSGKTHSFMLPILNQINPERPEVQAVITAPSRELAQQLYDVTQQLASYHPKGIRIENYIGGTDKQRQLDKLGKGKQPQVVIGTPGRIFDLMQENALWVQTASNLVVDEADMTMDLGFLTTVDEIASRMPKDLKMMVFSATIPTGLEHFLSKYMEAPQIIEIEPQQVIAETITNYLINTKGRSRKELAYDLLTMGYTYLAIVFTNTKAYADEISAYLKGRGLKVATLHGDLTSRERSRMMRQIRQLDFQYVVATDLAARGIDIPGVSLVINTEVPQNLEYFVHRVGRTGRQDIEGTAITFVTPDDDEAISQLENKGISFELVEYRQGELVPARKRHARKNRSDTLSDMDDPTVRGMIKRNQKRKVKPGYKRKLDRQIKDYRRGQQKQKQRQAR